jgi:hypothetical protein
MRKLSYFLIGLLIAVVLAPLTFAKSDYPVYIKNADIYTRPLSQGIAGEVTICSSNNGRIKFELKAVNKMVNVVYKRKFLALESGCDTYNLFFNNDFNTASAAGDKIELALINIQDENSGESFKKPELYKTVIEDRYTPEDPCGDSKGGDNTYDACVGDSITHAPTGVRVKVIAYDRDKADLVITGIRWGGIEKLRIYQGREKRIIAGNNDLTSLVLTNLGKGEEGNLNIMIESN